MDKILTYRSRICTLLQRYLTHKPAYGDIELQLIEDTKHDHYQVFAVGWHKDRQIHGCMLHFDIKNGKIWIQHNNTEDDVAAELVVLGVPKEDIVLGFQAPVRRRYSEYAIN
ncbi:fatty-acid oxidation protein subunit alpha [Achromatium sp. WMS1]|nr:fatty-acid oxidation protein subunit alpha [Achromatium sp. WMS1]